MISFSGNPLQLANASAGYCYPFSVHPRKFVAIFASHYKLPNLASLGCTSRSDGLRT
jgi:hypothetical protein